MAVNTNVQESLAYKTKANEALELQLEEQKLLQVQLDAAIGEQSRQLQLLQQSIAESDALTKELQSQVNEIRAFPERQMNSDELKAEIGDLDRVLAEKIKARAAAETEIGILQGRLSSCLGELTKKRGAVATHVKSTEDTLASLRNVTVLTTQMENIRQALGMLELAARKDIKNVEILTDALQGVVQFAQQGGDTSALGEQVNALLSGLDQTATADDIHRFFAQTQGLVDELTDPQTLEGLTRELKKLEDTLSEKLADADQPDAHRWLSDEVRNLGNRIGLSEAKVSDLNREIAILNARKTQADYCLTKLNRPTDAATPALQSSAAVESELVVLKEAARKNKQQMAELTKELSEVLKVKNDLQATLEKTQAELDRTKSTSTRTSANTKAAEARIADLEAENEKLFAQVQSFAKTEIDLRVLQAQLNQESKELEALGRQNATLQDALTKPGGAEFDASAESQSLLDELGKDVADFQQDFYKRH